LDYTCGNGCAGNTLPKVTFVPKFVSECRGERAVPTTPAATTVGADETTTAAVTTMPFDMPCPADYDCDAVYNRCCRVVATTATTSASAITSEPANGQDGGSNPGEGTPDGSSGKTAKQNSTELAVILAFSISLGLLVLGAALYYLRKFCKTSTSAMCCNGDSASLGGESMAMSKLGERRDSTKDMIRAVTSGAAVLKIGGLEDSGTADDEEPVPDRSAAELTGVVRDEFFGILKDLKKDQQRIKLLLESMQKRQEAKRTVEGKQKYDTIIDDLTRILALFRQKKTDQKAPADGMQLLAWCKDMLLKFASG